LAKATDKLYKASPINIEKQSMPVLSPPIVFNNSNKHTGFARAGLLFIPDYALIATTLLLFKFLK